MSSPHRGRLAALALPLLLAACAPRAADDGTGAGAAPEGTPAPAPASALVTSLQVEAFAPDSVRLVLHATNAGDAPLAVVFPSGQSHDLAVSQNGRELWRWSADMGFTQAVREETWAPGETRTFAGTWVIPAGTRGELVASARLASSSHPAERTTPFRLP